MAAQKDLTATVKQVYKAKESFMAVSEGDLVVELEKEALHVVKKTVTSISRLTKRHLGPPLNKKTYLPSLIVVVKSSYEKPEREPHFRKTY